MNLPKDVARAIASEPPPTKRSKLTWEAVREMRASQETHVELAKRFGVSAGAVAHIRKGRTWTEQVAPPRTTRPGEVEVPLACRGGIVKEYATVDEADAPRVLELRWSAYFGGRGGGRYARTFLGDGQGHLLLHHFLVGKPEPGYVVDHVDCNGLNNTRANLRFVTHTQNMWNRSGPTKANKSGYRGVSWCAQGQAWQASVQVDGHAHWLGLHATPEAANAVASAFRAKHMPTSADAREAA